MNPIVFLPTPTFQKPSYKPNATVILLEVLCTQAFTKGDNAFFEKPRKNYNKQAIFSFIFSVVRLRTKPVNFSNLTQIFVQNIKA